jgi:hypothetical protein|tara:strand:- start:84 stop:311 length:228 start_codon:yes stop_codon:yes gene_type:complete
MIDAFLLMVYLGTGDFRKLESGNMHFYSIVECNYFAEQISKRYGNYGFSEYIDAKDRVTAYCVPRQVDPELVKIY